MTKWMHKCSTDWLRARQQCLTATDVKELLPITKTGRKRTVGTESYLKVLSKKLAKVVDEDALSTGAAARGHVLEPFAIDLYNMFAWLKDEDATELYHWDDVVVTRENHVCGGLAFSPDAMSVKQADLAGNKVLAEATPHISEIGEVKSYGAENHLIRGYTDKKELEERWQIATAMAVCHSIEVAHLIFFNPSLKDQMFIVDYTPADLASEIETILEVEDNWLAWLKDYTKLTHNTLIEGLPSKEQEIVDIIIEREKLNPEDERTVIL